jgi:hypothetical protein
MRTCGMMGEVVGKAASICIKYNCTPRDVYADHFEELRDLLNLPGRARRSTVNDTPNPEAPLPEIASHPAARRMPGGGSTDAKPGQGLDPKTLPGIVIDDTQAKLTGKWSPGTNLKPFVGKQYLYDSGGAGAGNNTATFEFTVPSAGQYEVRMSYTPHSNRAPSVPVTIKSADGDKTVTVNEQQDPPPQNKGFVPLGTFRFDPARPGEVVVSNKGAQGHVCIDAVQVLPK